MNIRFHSTIIAAVRAASYRVTEDELVKLIETKVAGDKVTGMLDDDYFRIQLRRNKDADHQNPGDALEVHKVVSKAMLDRVNAITITPDIKPNPADSSEVKAEKTAKRQAASNFARSAACVLRKYIEMGGDLGALDPEVHGKNAVASLTRTMKAEADEESGENTPEAKVAKRLASLITALNQIPGGSARNAAVAQCVDVIQRSC
jgi:hypothetical protein